MASVPSDYQSAILELHSLHEKLEERNVILLSVRVRSRIDELERKFVHPKIRNETRRTKWSEILNSSSKFCKSKVELNNFRASITVDHDAFINTICVLYSHFSDMAISKILFGLPYNRKTIENMFRTFGITPDDNEVETVEALLTPIAI